LPDAGRAKAPDGCPRRLAAVVSLTTRGRSSLGSDGPRRAGARF